MTLREARIEDAPVILELIRELALFEKAPEQVTNTLGDIERDGFGDHPVFWCILAEEGGTVAGMSLYYLRYSTWKGKRLYLEDIIVREAYRGKGIGSLLFEATKKAALKLNVSGMVWQVLEWNAPAIRFYEKYDCNFDGEWINCSLELDALS